MADLNALLYKVMPFAPNLSESVALKFMLEACRSFCRDTHVVQQTLPTVTTSSADVTVADPSASLNLCGFRRITSGGYTIWSRSEQVIDNVMGFNDYKALQTAPLPTSVVFNGFNAFTLVPAPSGSITLTIKAAVMPAIGSDPANVPNDLVGRWHEAVVSGALREILSHPNQQYTNQNLAATHAAIYAAKVIEARIRVSTNDSPTGGRVVGPKFI